MPVCRPERQCGHRRTSTVRLERSVERVCRLRDYSALRASPSGSPFGRSTSLRDVVEPGMFYVGGSNLRHRAIAAEKRNLDGLQGICRLRDSNPRPTVYKTVALPLC